MAELYQSLGKMSLFCLFALDQGSTRWLAAPSLSPLIFYCLFQPTWTTFVSQPIGQPWSSDASRRPSAVSAVQACAVDGRCTSQTFLPLSRFSHFSVLTTSSFIWFLWWPLHFPPAYLCARACVHMSVPLPSLLAVEPVECELPTSCYAHDVLSGHIAHDDYIRTNVLKIKRSMLGLSWRRDSTVTAPKNTEMAKTRWKLWSYTINLIFWNEIFLFDLFRLLKLWGRFVPDAFNLSCGLYRVQFKQSQFKPSEWNGDSIFCL